MLSHFDSDDDWCKIIKHCMKKSHCLFMQEPKFLRDMLDQIMKGHKPSERQASWIMKIYRR